MGEGEIRVGEGRQLVRRGEVVQEAFGLQLTEDVAGRLGLVEDGLLLYRCRQAGWPQATGILRNLKIFLECGNSLSICLRNDLYA